MSFESCGCTAGVHNSWGHHMAQNAVRFGNVGRSLSALVDARKSTEILLKVMVETPGLMKCDDRAVLAATAGFVTMDLVLCHSTHDRFRSC